MSHFELGVHQVIVQGMNSYRIKIFNYKGRKTVNYVSTFPDPTEPIIAQSCPRLTVRDIFSNVLIPLPSHEAVTFFNSIALSEKYLKYCY